MTTVTITPLRRQVRDRTELRPLPKPRSLSQMVQVRALGTLAKVAPALTLDVLHRHYFTPPRYRAAKDEREILDAAERATVPVQGREVAVYAWGNEFPWEKTPQRTAWLVHGWGGAAAQMTPFVAPLLEAGYRVCAFDAPAHGGSPGEQTTVAEMAEILRALTDGEQPAAVIAHSLGGSAVLIAAARGLSADRYVLIAPGARLDRYPLRFAQAAGMSEAIGEALRRRLFDEFGEDVLQPGLAPQLDRALALPLLLVHDVDDREMPHDDSRELAARWTNARLVNTAGLGHRRILKDTPVIEEVISFLG